MAPRTPRWGGGENPPPPHCARQAGPGFFWAARWLSRSVRVDPPLMRLVASAEVWSARSEPAPNGGATKRRRRDAPQTGIHLLGARRGGGECARPDPERGLGQRRPADSRHHHELGDGGAGIENPRPLWAADQRPDSRRDRALGGSARKRRRRRWSESRWACRRELRCLGGDGIHSTRRRWRIRPRQQQCCDGRWRARLRRR